jgi:hypothetical protein
MNEGSISILLLLLTAFYGVWEILRIERSDRNERANKANRYVDRDGKGDKKIKNNGVDK